jgi:hypothetical protein
MNKHNPGGLQVNLAGIITPVPTYLLPHINNPVLKLPCGPARGLLGIKLLGTNKNILRGFPKTSIFGRSSFCNYYL